MAVNNVGNAFTPQGPPDPLALCTLGVALFQAGAKADCYRLLVSGFRSPSFGLGGDLCVVPWAQWECLLTDLRWLVVHVGIGDGACLVGYLWFARVDRTGGFELARATGGYELEASRGRPRGFCVVAGRGGRTGGGV